MTRHYVLTAALTLAAVTILRTEPASAFKEPGHRAIEAEAYRRLLACDEAGNCPGQELLEKLIAHGVLKAPRRPFPEPSSLHADFANHAVEGLLLETHLPDHLLDRQLEKDLQCFHFNARGSHVTKIGGEMFGVPRGLVVDAYVECLGVSDALLRGVLFDPAGSDSKAIGIYSLMHLIEDSYADSHVARSSDDKHPMIYVKPWNLRTWWSYFISEPGSPNGATRAHFSDTHHGGFSEPRDLGYLITAREEDWPDPDPLPFGLTRSKRREDCLRRVAFLLGKAEAEESDLEGETIVPGTCLSNRALEASSALVALLELVSKFVDKVKPAEQDARVRRVSPLADGTTFAQAWLDYRKTYLLHVDSALTETMALSTPGPPCPPAGCVMHGTDVRADLVYPAPDLMPGNFRSSAVGISTELTAGTPLWLGYDAFVFGDARSHSQINPLTDYMGLGVQLRLPIENEFGERPVGIALDFGPTLPVPLSELMATNPTYLVAYIGLRGRAAYTAQSVFEDDTRHVVSAGFGGVSLDFVATNRIWFGLDFPRYMWSYDTWEDSGSWTMSWNFNGGVAFDAL
jgi:hypothetical protein